MREIAVIVILVICCFLCCCNIANTSIDYSVVFDEFVEFGFKENESGGRTIGIYIIIHRFEELKDLCFEWNNNAFSNDYMDNPTQLGDCLRMYNDDYFTNKDLIIVSTCSWHMNPNPKIQNIYIKDLILNIEINQKLKKIHTDEAVSFTFIVETNKEQTCDISKINLIIK